MEKLKTVNLKGKEYVMVNERLKWFRKNFPGHSLETWIESNSDNRVIMRAVIKNEEGRTIATGYASEVMGSGVNKDSHIENCETSAWGRALGNFGIGIDSSIASAEEVQGIVQIPRAETQDKFLDAVKRLESADAVYTAIDMTKEEVKKIFASGTADDYQRLNDALFELEAK